MLIADKVKDLSSITISIVVEQQHYPHTSRLASSLCSCRTSAPIRFLALDHIGVSVSRKPPCVKSQAAHGESVGGAVILR